MIRILHTADWHIDSPLREFTDLQRRNLRASLLELPGKIADVCIREACDLVLLAGDVFDGPYTREGYEAVYRALERMAVPVFLTPGNHDPYREGSPWTEELWPDNVYIFRDPAITSYSIRELSCRIYGAAFTGPESPALLEGFQADCAEGHMAQNDYYHTGYFRMEDEYAEKGYYDTASLGISIGGKEYTWWISIYADSRHTIDWLRSHDLLAPEVRSGNIRY